MKSYYLTMTTIGNMIDKKFYATKENMDDHEYVRQSYESPNNTDLLIKAMIVRDYVYCSDMNVKSMFERHCRKVGMIYDQTRVKSIFIDDFAYKVRNMIYEENFPDLTNPEINKTIFNLYEDHALASKTKYEGDPDRYETIMKMIDENKTLYEIYNQFTHQELQTIGW